MPTAEYRQRPSFADKGDVLWRASADKLEQIAPDGTVLTTVPYKAVRRVRLAFAPGRYQTNRFLMELSGIKSRIVLSNLHFAGIGRFEDRSESFFALVREVVDGVRRSNPDAEFTAGEQPVLYAMLLAFNLSAFAMLALAVTVLPIVPGNISASVAIKAVLILFSLPLLFSWIAKARPRRFDPVYGLEDVIAAR
jgi:hypothetical protein